MGSERCEDFGAFVRNTKGETEEAHKGKKKARKSKEKYKKAEKKNRKLKEKGKKLKAEVKHQKLLMDEREKRMATEAKLGALSLYLRLSGDKSALAALEELEHG